MHQRTSGLLLHPTSLPGAGPSGTLGGAALEFVGFLAASGSRLWQVLPLGPPAAADSPYMATSAFALNPLLLDAEDLIARGWLAPETLLRRPARAPESDFAAHAEWQRTVLIPALVDGFSEASTDAECAAFTAFCAASDWLHDFALFEVIGQRHGAGHWQRWPEELRDRDAAALARFEATEEAALHAVKLTQFAVDLQWQAVRAAAHRAGIQIVGDIPIFVSLHSADVWTDRALFSLDASGEPAFVAGVPPDYFSEIGQRWGNPLFDWQESARTGHRWWIRRVQACLRQADLIRIDHFRGFEAYWAIPAAAPDARSGSWQPGPGRAFFDALRAALGDLPIIAEDLGIITPEVEALRDGLGLPGMKILHFAFGGGDDHPYLPHNFPTRCVAYTGTHDNDTTVGWYEASSEAERDRIRRYLSADGQDIAWQLMEPLWRSSAERVVVPVQDLLSLGTQERMNRPGTATGNWCWRLRDGALTEEVAERLRALNHRYGRM